MRQWRLSPETLTRLKRITNRFLRLYGVLEKPLVYCIESLLSINIFHSQSKTPKIHHPTSFLIQKEKQNRLCRCPKENFCSTIVCLILYYRPVTKADPRSGFRTHTLCCGAPAPSVVPSALAAAGWGAKPLPPRPWYPRPW